MANSKKQTKKDSGKPDKKAMEALVLSAKADASRFSGYAEPIENPNAILRETDEGILKGLELFEEMERDPQVFGDLQIRKLKVSSLPFSIHVDSEDERDHEQARELERDIKRIYRQGTKEFQDAISKGHAICELMLTVGENGKIVIVKIKGHKQKDFFFTTDWELRALSSDSPGGLELPVDRVVVVTFDERKGNRYGRSLLTSAFWAWMMKKHGWLFWSIFLEKFGQPTAVGTYPPGTPPDEQKKLLDALNAIQSEMSVIMPEGWTTELIEAMRGGAINSYKDFVSFNDRYISKVILMTTLTSNESEYGTRAQATVQTELTDEVVQDDARWLEDIWTEQVVKRLARWNYNFSVEPELVIHYESEDTGKEAAERDEILSRVVPLVPADIYDRYNLDTPADDKPVVFNGVFYPTFAQFKEKMASNAIPGPGAPVEVEKPEEAGVDGGGQNEGPGFAESDTVDGDVDALDLMLMEDAETLSRLFDANRGLLKNTVDTKQLIKLLSKTDTYEGALLQLSKYKSGSEKIWTKFLTLARLVAENSVQRQVALAEGEERGGLEFAEGTQDTPTRGLTELEPGAAFDYGNPDAAIRWFRKKTAISKEVWDKLEGDAKSAAFTVSNLEDLKDIVYVQEKILDSIENGMPYSDFKLWMKMHFKDEKVFLSNIRTTFNTNVFSALAVQSETAMRRVTDRLPFWRYSAVLDGKTRPSHAALHDFVARYDAPAWSTISPPNGFNCRCRKVVCSQTRFEKLQTKWQADGKNVNDYPPDQGFDVNPYEANFKELDTILKDLKAETLNLNKIIREKALELEKKKGGKTDEK